MLGELVWHAYDDEEEVFLVVYGNLRIQMEGLPGGRLGPGEFFVVARGVLHNLIAEQELGLVLTETTTTAHTGSMQVAGTVSIERQLG